MASPVLKAITQIHYSAVTAGSLEARWYAVYTIANHEKRVAEHLVRRSIEHFLPMYQSVRQWKDRRVQLQLPLFPGYLFVYLAERDRLRVSQTPGVARFVGFGGIPAALPDEEIDVLRTRLRNGMRAEPYAYMTAGQKVKVKSGSLTGLEGILVRRKNDTRLVISLDLIMRSVAVEIEGAEVEPI
jgi:transcription elongation factor/antiterminator RfaH